MITKIQQVRTFKHGAKHDCNVRKQDDRVFLMNTAASSFMTSRNPDGEQGTHGCSTIQSGCLPQAMEGSLLHFVVKRVPTPIIEDRGRNHTEITHCSAEACIEETLTRQFVRPQIQLLQRHKLAHLGGYASCLSHSGAPDGISKHFYAKTNQQ